MSIQLISNPVTTVDSVVNNLFAGFEPVEFGFKREDLQIVSVDLGVGAYVRITIASDLTTVLDVGDQLYLGAEGITGYQYDDSGTITAITSTTIDAEIEFIESATSGYINYLINWHLECQLVNPDNTLIKVIPFSLIDDGDNAGNVTIDTSIANDKNIQYFEFITQLLEDSRIVFKLQYKQVYENSSDPYTLIDDEIILVYATEQMEIESFINELDEPKLWKGYPFGLILSHSNQNSEGAGIALVYDELDINQSTLTSDNTLYTLNADEQGLFFNNIDKDIVYDSDTEYIKIKTSYSTYPQYNASQYNNAQYNTA